MSPVKVKKPSKRASKAEKNDTKEKEPPKDRTKAEEIALCQAWCDVSENNEKGNSMKAKGFWEVVINYFEKETDSTRGIQRSEKKSKTSETTSGSASGDFNLNNDADEFEEETQELRPMGRDRSKAKKKSSTSSREGSSSFVDLEATRKEAAELKRVKLEIKRRTLELAEKKGQRHLIL
ncbi:hypothetical protein Tco_0439171 [Tanacetum coccineum]